MRFSTNVTKENYLNSPYYLWYEFLRRSDQRKWSKEVACDFSKSIQDDFWDWWIEHEDLFLDGISLGIWPIEKVGEFRKAMSENWAVIKVDLTCPMDYLKVLFHDFLIENGLGARGPHKSNNWIVEPAKYAPARRIKIDALKMMLKVYDLQKTYPEKRQWEIGVLAGVNGSQIPKSREPDSELKRVLTSIVSRYLKKAEKIIRNVERGVFPQ